MAVFMGRPNGRCVMAGIMSSAFSGSRKVKITFPSRGRCTRGGLNYLLELLEVGAIRIPDHDEEFLAAVRDTGDWEGDQNRSFVVEFDGSFDLDYAAAFAQKMLYSLEHIEVV